MKGNLDKFIREWTLIFFLVSTAGLVLGQERPASPAREGLDRASSGEAGPVLDGSRAGRPGDLVDAGSGGALAKPAAPAAAPQAAKPADPAQPQAKGGGGGKERPFLSFKDPVDVAWIGGLGAAALGLAISNPWVLGLGALVWGIAGIIKLFRD